MEANSTQNQAQETGAEPRVSSTTRHQNHQGDWIEKMRGTLMLVATVIATMTFQIAINPPGGVWQQSTDNRNGPSNQTYAAGTSVLASTQKDLIERLLIICTISFSSSLTIILLLMFKLPVSTRVTMWIMIIAMCISVFFTAAAYILAIMMVMEPSLNDTTVKDITWYCSLYWVGLFLLVFLILTIRCVCWLIKNLLIALYRAICFLIGLLVKLCRCVFMVGSNSRSNEPPAAGVGASRRNMQV